MLIFQYSAYFRNHLNTKITLYSTIVSTGVNLFFDFSLVYGAFGLPRLGTAGAAWGSVIGLSVGLLVYQFAYYRRHSISDICCGALAGKRQWQEEFSDYTHRCRERFVFVCTAVGTIAVSISAVAVGIMTGLSGIFFLMIAEFVILGIFYLRKEQRRNGD